MSITSPLNMPTARVSLTISSSSMPLLEKGKKKREEPQYHRPWEKEPGYWETPYGRRAVVSIQ